MRAKRQNTVHHTSVGRSLRPLGKVDRISQRKTVGDRLSLAVITAAIILVPIVIAPATFLAYDIIPKLAILLISLAVLLLVLPLTCGGILSNLWKDWTARAFLVLLTVHVFGIVLSSALSPVPAMALAGTVFRRFGLIGQISTAALGLFTGVALSRHASARSFLLNAMIATGVAEAAYAIAQFMGIDPLLSQATYLDYTVLRPPATLGHALYLGGFLVIPSLAAIAQVFGTISLRRRLVYATAALIQFAAILITGSRSAVAGALAGGAYLGFRVLGTADRRSRFFAGAIPAAVVALIAFLFWSGNPAFLSRIHQATGDYKGGPRLLVWRDSLRMISARRFIGFGPDTFMREFPLYASAELSSRYPNFVHEAPHNVFLDYLTTEGIVGCCSFVGLLVIGLVACEQRRRADPACYFGIHAAILGSCVWMFFANLTIPNALFIQTLIAMAIAVRAAPVSGASIPVRRPMVAYTGCAAAAVATVAYLFTASDLRFRAAQMELKAGRLGEAITEYRAATRFSFPGPVQDEWFSEQLAQYAMGSGDNNSARAWKLAREASERASINSDESASAFYQAALLAMVAHDDKAGEARLRSAIERAPTWYRPRLLLAQLYTRTGRSVEAEAAGEQAIRLSGALEAQVREALRHPEKGPV